MTGRRVALTCDAVWGEEQTDLLAIVQRLAWRYAHRRVVDRQLREDLVQQALTAAMDLLVGADAITGPVPDEARWTLTSTTFYLAAHSSLYRQIQGSSIRNRAAPPANPTTEARRSRYHTPHGLYGDLGEDQQPHDRAVGPAAEAIGTLTIHSCITNLDRRDRTVLSQVLTITSDIDPAHPKKWTGAVLDGLQNTYPRGSRDAWRKELHRLHNQLDEAFSEEC